MNPQTLQTVSEFGYIAASILFIYGLKMLSRAETARRGNLLSALGMLLAVVVTLLHEGLDFKWIVIGALIGGTIGGVAARVVKMTAMPEMVAVFNGFGGISSLLVGWAEYHARTQPVVAPASTLRQVGQAISDTAGELAAEVTTAVGGGGEGTGLPLMTVIAIYLAVMIGGVTFSGSMVAYAKLAERISGRPTLFTGQHILNATLMLAALAGGVVYCLDPAANYPLFLGVVGLSLVLGVLVVIPIGGADMPVVISLLNSYSGMAACAAGFVINNNVLIVAGSLVGASGIILTVIMCKAMNRPLTNVLFAGFGASAGAATGGGDGVQGEVNPINTADAYLILEAASSVMVVPGYGMAVAQAQHVVRELGELLEANGCEVKYAVHPVAGRMPGHMNVLLAEANVPYEQLAEMDEVNPVMALVDVAMVIGANDVVNPAAREDESSPIYGMPIINVDHARTVFVLKRSMASGFAGIANPLFFKPNTRMLFGDAKQSVSAIVAEFKDSE